MDRRIFVLGCGVLLSSCAGVEFGKQDAFGDRGLVFFDPIPYLFVSVTPDCNSTSSIVALPGRGRSVQIKNGYGSSEVTLAFTGGLLTSVGQKTDSKAPETLTSVAALVAALAQDPTKEKKAPCEATATLYPIANGAPDIGKPIRVPVTKAQ